MPDTISGSAQSSSNDKNGLDDIDAGIKHNDYPNNLTEILKWNTDITD